MSLSILYHLYLHLYSFLFSLSYLYYIYIIIHIHIYVILCHIYIYTCTQSYAKSLLSLIYCLNRNIIQRHVGMLGVFCCQKAEGHITDPLRNHGPSWNMSPWPCCAGMDVASHGLAAALAGCITAWRILGRIDHACPIPWLGNIWASLNPLDIAIKLYSPW